jgi:hypothetical protein
MVHDIAQQAYANCAVLAAPVALACSDQVRAGAGVPDRLIGMTY